MNSALFFNVLTRIISEYECNRLFVEGEQMRVFSFRRRPMALKVTRGLFDYRRPRRMTKDFFCRPRIRNVTYRLFFRLKKSTHLSYIMDNKSYCPITVFNVYLFRVFTNDCNDFLSVVTFIRVLIRFRSRLTSHNKRGLP